jgi:HAD superfamily hydrolase (TIGR01509 family)
MTQPQPNITRDKLPQYKAVLWDMDGTLVHSDPVHAICVSQIGDEMGLAISDELAWSVLGVSHRHAYDELAKHFGSLPWTFEQLVAREAELYIEKVAQINARENIVDVIKALRSRGIRQAIFSNNPRLFIDATTKGLLRFFDEPETVFETVISLDDVPAKPDPTGYLLACERLGLKPEECLVIEDSPTGAAAGVAAGCFTIYWPGPHSNKPLKSEPDLIVDDLDFLL